MAHIRTHHELLDNVLRMYIESVLSQVSFSIRDSLWIDKVFIAGEWATAIRTEEAIHNFPKDKRHNFKGLKNTCELRIIQDMEIITQRIIELREEMSRKEPVIKKASNHFTLSLCPKGKGRD